MTTEEALQRLGRLVDANGDEKDCAALDQLQMDLNRLEAELADPDRMKWVRAFNSLEKPVEHHIDICPDANDLARAHRIVLREFGPVPA